VATDEVYFATENGQILDVDYRNMALFRSQPLYTLLTGVTSTIGRLGRPNNAVEFVKRQRDEARERSMSLKGGPRAGSVIQQNSLASPRVPGLQRRGTVSFVKNVMLQRIQSKNQSSVADGSVVND